MKQTSTYVLIAMWLWCVAAAGETIPITTQSLDANNNHAVLTMPCNWDKDLDKVMVTGVYANPGEYTDVASFSILDRDSVVAVEITNVSLSLSANDGKLHLGFSPDLPRTIDGKYLYHLNVEIGTTKSRCKQGFGFGFGTR